MSSYEKKREYFKSELSKATYKETLTRMWFETQFYLSNYRVALANYQKCKKAKGDKKLMGIYLNELNIKYGYFWRFLKYFWDSVVGYLVEGFQTENDKKTTQYKEIDLIDKMVNNILPYHPETFGIKTKDGIKPMGIQQLIEMTMNSIRKHMVKMIPLDTKLDRYVDIKSHDRRGNK